MGSHWRTARQMSGDNHLPGLPTARGAHTPNLISFPSGSLLEPVEVAEPPLYKFSVFERALFVLLTALAVVSAFIILFVET